MQQYMLQIIEQLQYKGYNKLNPDSNNVYGRVDNDAVYVVVVGSSHNLHADNLKRFNEKVKHDLEINTGKPVNLLNLLITENGLFDKDIQGIVDKVENVWLFTEDYGKLYVFENQPLDFDGLYSIMDKSIKPANDVHTKRVRYIFGIVTPILILINIVIYIIGVMNGTDVAGRTVTVYKMGLNLYAVQKMHEYYRIFTAMFVHFEIMHLCSNMIVLAALGARVESLFGRFKFIIIYVISGLAASVSSLISCYMGESYIWSVGASGAIFGLMGALIAYALINKNQKKNISLKNLLILCILNVINGYLSDGIDNAAHIGGLIAGLVIGIIITLFNQKVVKQS